MSQNYLQNFVKFQKFQLENLVDFEKCCRTHIYLQKSEPIQPKTSNILPKFCQPTLSDVSEGAGARAAPHVQRHAKAVEAGPRAVGRLAAATVGKFVLSILANFGCFRLYLAPTFAGKYSFCSIFLYLKSCLALPR